MAKSRKQSAEIATEIEIRKAGLHNLADLRGENRLEDLTEESRFFNDGKEQLKVVSAKDRPVPKKIRDAILENPGTVLVSPNGKYGLFVWLESFVDDDQDKTITVIKALQATETDGLWFWADDCREDGVVIATYREATEYSILEGDDGRVVVRLPKGMNWTRELRKKLDTLDRNLHHQLFMVPVVKSQDLTIINAFKQGE